MVDSQEEENGLSFDDAFATHEGIQPPFAADDAPTPMRPTEGLSTTEPVARDILGAALNFPPTGIYAEYDNDPFLGDLDFSFLNDLGPSRVASPPPPDLVSNPTPQQSTMSVGAEAYKLSTALTAWNPSKEDNYDQEQQDLILAQNAAGASGDKCGPFPRQGYTQKGVISDCQRPYPSNDPPADHRDRLEPYCYFFSFS